MKISEVLMGGISEVYFRYAAKSEVYANLSSDIPKLSEMRVNNKGFSYGCIKLATN